MQHSLFISRHPCLSTYIVLITKCEKQIASYIRLWNKLPHLSLSVSVSFPLTHLGRLFLCRFTTRIICQSLALSLPA